jgi:hypothetical protein
MRGPVSPPSIAPGPLEARFCGFCGIDLTRFNRDPRSPLTCRGCAPEPPYAATERRWLDHELAAAVREPENDGRPLEEDGHQ